MKLFGIEIRKATRYKQGKIEDVTPKGPAKFVIFGRSFPITDIIFGILLSIISVIVISAFFVGMLFYRALHNSNERRRKNEQT